VLRLTWKMLTEHPELVMQTIRQALDPYSSAQWPAGQAGEPELRPHARTGPKKMGWSCC